MNTRIITPSNTASGWAIPYESASYRSLWTVGSGCSASFRQNKHEVIACDRTILDITNLEQCQQVISEFQPDTIIHCAPYTAVDAAEADVDGAYKVNAVGTRNVVIATEKVSAKFVYISTDYVFNGCSAVPYQEYENTDPQSVYGKSKRAGEILTLSLSSRYFIVRTSWVYGLNGNNFVKRCFAWDKRNPCCKLSMTKRVLPPTR